MKKLLLVLLILGMAVSANAATFYRIIWDIPVDNINTAIAIMNLLESNKGKVHTAETLEGNEPVAKLVGSFDTEFTNAPEYTMINVDFDAPQKTYLVADYDSFTQDDIDAKQAYIDAKAAKLAELQAAVDAAQAELDAQP